MSVPYGAPAAPRNSPSPDEPAGGRDLTFVLTALAAGIGPVSYLFGFFDAQASAVFSGLTGFCMIAASTLAGLRLLPASPHSAARPNTLVAAAPFAVFATLALAQGAAHGGPGVIAIVILMMAVVQLGGVGAVLLGEAGVVRLPGAQSASAGAGSAAAQSGPRPGPPGPQAPPFGRPPQGQPGGWNPPSGGQVPPGQHPSPGQPVAGHPGPAQPGAWGNPHPSGPPAGGWSPQPGGPSSAGHSAQTSLSRSGQLDQPGPFSTAEPAETSKTEHVSPDAVGQPAPSQSDAAWSSSSQEGQSQTSSGVREGTRQMPHPGSSGHTPPRGF